ncbi:MAG: class I SAM-dependent methyltransferase [Pseudolabrys sp.]|nr:class I SAM-dependent methyltransferase [Pseudolabrys sp.]MDP2296345.1 class I SAM-dependent methyltransferase [Pseudolabrys sp.]
MTDAAQTIAVYGAVPADVVEVPQRATQFSPLMPGAAALEQQTEASLSALTMLAPPGTLERRYAIALGLRALAPGAPFTILAPNDRGGTRLRKELQALNCTVEENARRHHRIVTGTRPVILAGIDEALAQGGPRLIDDLGVWSQPGVFSWDRLDPGTALLIEHLPPLSGRGADFGCGIGILAHAALASPAVTEITLADIDRRAVECAQHNVADPRARFLWTDLRSAELSGLDFVVMNAPFHDAGAEDKSLAQTFVKRAARALGKGGVCYMVANRHLPYEAILTPVFKRTELVIEAGGYKIYEART